MPAMMISAVGILTYKIPQYVATVLKALQDAGVRPYVVGGAVRDLVMGRDPKDYDIAVNALPEHIIAIVADKGWRVVDKLGHNFGVVMAAIENNCVEIATFRRERYGLDSHRPEEVWFADTIEEDLARRDFTINAMALNLDGQLLDPHRGMADISARIIRTVGEPAKRFREDALRMFRACRFAAELGFDIDEITKAAIAPNLQRVEGLSLERVREELSRTLAADACDKGLDVMVRTGLLSVCCRVKKAGAYHLMPILPELNHLVDLPQNPAYHSLDVWAHTLKVIQEVPSQGKLRWAALLHDVAKGLSEVRKMEEDGKISEHGHERMGAEIARQVLRRLGFGERFIRNVGWLVRKHMYFYNLNGNRQAILRWLRTEARSGEFADRNELVAAVQDLSALFLADLAATGEGKPRADTAREMTENIIRLAETIPVHTRDIAYTPDELAAVLGEKGRMGLFLKNALRRIQDGSLANNRDEIMIAARRWIQRHHEISSCGEGNFKA